MNTRMRFRSIFVFAVLLCVGVFSYGDVVLPSIFSDDMVLQRGLPVPVFGSAEPGENVTVSFADRRASAIADADGRWIVRLPVMEAESTGKPLTVKGKNTVEFRNVVVGEVWFCSGQSNMEFTVRECNTGEGAAANEPSIRYIRVRRAESPEPADDISTDSNGWVTCQEKRAERVSATAFFFAKRLQKELDVPIGLIDSAWGASNIDSWIPPNGQAVVPELKDRYEQQIRSIERYRHDMPAYVAALKDWIPRAEKSLGEGKIVPSAPVPPASYVYYGAKFNGMVAPSIPYGIRGLIWYQGEANAGDGQKYFFKQKALVDGWRTAWNQPGEFHDFPFYFVQLANYKDATDNPVQGDDWNRIRDGQTETLQLKNAGMAVAIDIGEGKDIHPKNKFDVGERLAAWALAKDYGRKELVHFGPLFRTITVEGDKARIVFDHVGGGLIVGKKTGREPVVVDPQGKLKRFSVAGEDKVWHWADAVIDGNDVLVSSGKVAKPIAVRYAWSSNPEGCNLYNKEGFPACPFRTDNWYP